MVLKRTSGGRLGDGAARRCRQAVGRAYGGREMMVVVTMTMRMLMMC
jgi:hypothetical protein